MVGAKSIHFIRRFGDAEPRLGEGLLGLTGRMLIQGLLCLIGDFVAGLLFLS